MTSLSVVCGKTKLGCGEEQNVDLDYKKTVERAFGSLVVERVQ